MSLQNWPIVRKLAALLAFNTALVVLAMAVVFVVGSAYTRYRDMEQQLSAMAQVIGENNRAALAFNDPGGAKNVLKALQAQQDIAMATLFGPNGERFAHVDLLAERSPAGTLSRAVMPWLFPATMTVSHTIEEGEGKLEMGRLELVANLSGIWSDPPQSLAWMMVCALVLSVLAVRSGLRSHRILTAPVLHLAAAAHQVSRAEDSPLR